MQLLGHTAGWTVLHEAASHNHLDLLNLFKSVPSLYHFIEEWTVRLIHS